MKHIGLLIGDFEPLHLGHLQDINCAAGLCNELHVVILSKNNHHSQHPFRPTLADKVRWLQSACQPFDFIHVHTLAHLLADITLLNHHNWTYDAKDVGNIAQNLPYFHYLVAKLGIDNNQITVFHQCGAAVIHDTPYLWQALPDTGYDSANIYANPVTHFHALAPSAQTDYVQTVCIVGGESSGKTTLVHKLANHYGASVALEMGRLYTHSHLGGSELALQYSDYPIIAQQHWQAINEARQTTSAPLVIVDTDYVTTQAFCETYEGRSHPVLSALADNLRMDHTLMLVNNVAWVADGMRSLGSEDDRKAFAAKLLKLMKQHNITPHIISSPDYHQRYLQAVTYIDTAVLGKAAATSQAIA